MRNPEFFQKEWDHAKKKNEAQLKKHPDGPTGIISAKNK